MTTINKLTSVSSLAVSDLLAVWDTSNGDSRKTSITALLELLQANITLVDAFVTQYSTPTATGFSVQVEDDDDSVWLILTPLSGYAAGTIVLPALARSVDKQEVVINSTQAITTLTVDGNGATVIGEPTTMAANAFFRLRFDAVTSIWYRVG